MQGGRLTALLQKVVTDDGLFGHSVQFSGQVASVVVLEVFEIAVDYVTVAGNFGDFAGDHSAKFADAAQHTRP